MGSLQKTQCKQACSTDTIAIHYVHDVKTIKEMDQQKLLFRHWIIQLCFVIDIDLELTNTSTKNFYIFTRPALMPGRVLTNAESTLTLVRDEPGESSKPDFFISCLIISLSV